MSRIINPDKRQYPNKKGNNTIGMEVIINDSLKYDSVYHSLQNLKDMKSIGYVIGDSLPVMVSNIFYVKLKDETDTSLLKQVALQTNTDILRKVLYTNNWYALEVNQESNSNSLDIANIFSETNYFDKIDPGFILNFTNNCVSDSRFNEQWGINNSGIGINACAAWNLTTGTNGITVAVIDEGIDNTHTEFTGTHFTPSFDAVTSTSPAQINGPHGTHVCGIISSNHNQASIAGVAPGLSIMEVSTSFSISPTMSEKFASGINWAVQQGADVLNNSWGDQGHAFYNEFHSTLLESAIDNALDNGRNGKGCVVVFASGNFAPEMDYPANYRTEILTVGSCNSSGQRSIGSGFGTLLDIVAPGSGILSTIPNNLYDTWNGTSMAAPHVSAVAGLILSKYPDLTRLEVVNAIESSAQKVGSYNYQTEADRPNGTWNNEMEYGLVNAYGAIQAAAPCITTNFVNQPVTSNTTVNGCNINVQNVNVQNNAVLTVGALHEINVNGPFDVNLGSELLLYIILP